MPPSLTTHETDCARPRRPAASPPKDPGAVAGWDAFLNEARDLVHAPAKRNGEAGSSAADGLAALLAARFGFARAPRINRGGRVPAKSAMDARAGAWLDGWRFVRSDAEADPARRRLGPEAMARFHEAFAGGLGCVYTATGEVRFIARRALAEHLSRPHSEIPAVPRKKAFALLGARGDVLPVVAGGLTASERRAARARLRALRALDPACGAGAFLLGLLGELVRIGSAIGMGSPAAIAARALRENLFGVDIDPGAVEVAGGRLSLAARGRQPNLIAGDALALDWARAFPTLDTTSPAVQSAGRGGEGHFDLVLGNPPYLRQELIDSHPRLGPGAKGAAQAQVRRHWGRTLRISRRADLYVYFFLEGIRLLRPGGTLALLTSHAWLDLDYGAALRAFLLEEADLPLIAQSDYPSFRQASVNTVITIAVRRGPGGGEGETRARRAGSVGFARICDPFLRAAENPLFSALDARRDTEQKRLRLRLGAREALAPPTPGAPSPRWGARWLRGPSVFLRALARSAGRTVALADVADVVFGLKSGCNDFFYLEDAGPAEARGARGAPDLRWCRSRLDGKRYLIEARYLSPIVTTLKEVAGLVVRPDDLPRRVLAIPSRANLASARVTAYLRIGEQAGVHRRASVAARDPWFSLAPPRGAFLIPRRIGERMPVARSEGTAFDNNLFGITPRTGIDPVALHAVMNATITRLCLELEARELTGAQAVVDTNVYLVKAIPVPRPDLLLARKDELAHLLNALLSRSARSIFDELGAEDRNALDALVLSLWGLPAREVAALQEALADLVSRRLARVARGAGTGQAGGGWV